MVCHIEGCPRGASRNFPSVGAKPKYCSTHAPPGTINVMTNGRCKCGRFASFSDRRGERPRCCRECKTEAMFWVKGQLCESCNRSALFNLPGEPKPRFCSRHKSPRMIDVKTRRCEAPGCNAHPTHRPVGSKGRSTHCLRHAGPSWENNRRLLCIEEGCPKRRFFGIPGGPRLTCGVHGLPLGYVNLETYRESPESNESPESLE